LSSPGKRSGRPVIKDTRPGIAFASAQGILIQARSGLAPTRNTVKGIRFFAICYRSVTGEW